VIKRITSSGKKSIMSLSVNQSITQQIGSVEADRTSASAQENTTITTVDN